MNKPAILRLEPGGPANVVWTTLALDQEDFQSELPEQHWHIYFEDAQLGLTVGVWTTTPMQEAFGPYPGDEFMIILEGRVALLDGDDRQIGVKQGKSFVVSNGRPISWKQEGFCRKFFMTYQPQDTPPAKTDCADGTISVLNAAALEPLLQTVKSSRQAITAADTLQLSESICCTNDTGNMVSGRMQSEAFETTMAPSPHHELVQILTGHVQITEARGHVHEFRSGDVFFLPAGSRCAWRASPACQQVFLSR